MKKFRIIVSLLLAAIFTLSGLSASGAAVANTVQQHTFSSTGLEISSGNTATPVKHVVNIFLENHSFDNLFGIYPATRANGNLTVSGNLTVPLNLLGHSSVMKRLSEVRPGQFNTQNPVEGWVAYHQDWNHGKMNGFANGSGSQALTYFSASQMAPEWALAQQYGLADNYYAPQISESSPNHMYYLAGYSPVFNDYGPPPYIPFSQSIMGELTSYNISWAFYVEQPSKTFMDWHFFSGINAYKSNLRGWNDFASAVQNNSLPSVSWLFSQGKGNYSQGEPSNILTGELWLLHVVDLIENSPLWNSTAIFITYDEFGGFYDQVSPPVFHGVQLGFRIPLIVVSPYAKEDYISSTLLTHTSILAFIDYNWKMKALNTLVSESNIPLDFFDFSTPYNGSTVVRSSVSFASQYGFQVPGSMFFKINSTLMKVNYSSMFPLTPQIPFNQLPYGRTGSSGINLSAMGSGVFVKKDTPYVPFYESSYFLISLLLVQVTLAAIVYSRFRRRNNV